VEVPDGPGLGVEVNEEAIRRYPYAVAAGQPFILH
jgi:L-alanine-DL-glutamate epimerase-like enolase superfamily enzyme